MQPKYFLSIDQFTKVIEKNRQQMEYWLIAWNCVAHIERVRYSDEAKKNLIH